MKNAKAMKKEPTYMRFATEKEREVLAVDDDRPLLKKGKAIIKIFIKTRQSTAKLKAAMKLNLLEENLDKPITETTSWTKNGKIKIMSLRQLESLIDKLSNELKKK